MCSRQQRSIAFSKSPKLTQQTAAATTTSRKSQPKQPSPSPPLLGASWPESSILYSLRNPSPKGEIRVSRAAVRGAIQQHRDKTPADFANGRTRRERITVCRRGRTEGGRRRRRGSRRRRDPAGGGGRETHTCWNASRARTERKCGTACARHPCSRRRHVLLIKAAGGRHARVYVYVCVDVAHARASRFKVRRALVRCAPGVILAGDFHCYGVRARVPSL